MVWPPDPLPNNRSNITPQLDNHPSDHNDIANTLATDFVEQISENIAAILINAGAISGNTGAIGVNAGGIAANLASINAQLVNFVPGADPIVRGNGALFQNAGAAPIGTGRLSSIQLQRGQGTGPPIPLTGVATLIPGTTVNTVATVTGQPAVHLCIGTVDIEGGGASAAFAQGFIFLNGVQQGPATAVFNYSTPNTGRATCSVTFLATLGTAAAFDLRVNQQGFLGQVDPGHSSLAVISIYP